MTQQEQEMIDGLVDRIRNTQVNDKDLAAEQHLQQGLAGNPDAMYVMAQTVLVQQYGLQQAQQQIQSLQQQLDQAKAATSSASSGGGSFLSHLFGGGQQAPPSQGYSAAQVPYQPVNSPPYSQSYPPQQQVVYAQPVFAQQPMGYGMGGGGGFLRGAMQTAAGVAAGEMMFQGMESLFHGFGGHEGYGGYGGGRPEEVVNNYYGDSGGHEHVSHDDSSFFDPKHDAASQGDSGQGFADTSNDSDESGNADTSADDSANDDANSFDGNSDDAGYDDGGSFSDDNS